jgi:hypothetical protein
VDQSHDFEISLEDNALDSLSEALIALREKRSQYFHKHVIFNLFHSISMYLKAVLERKSSELIFVDRKIVQGGKTVDFDEALKRLKASGTNFNEEQKRDLRYLKNNLRNPLEHHVTSFDTASVEETLARAARFLEVFVRDNLAIEFKEVLDSENYETMRDTLYSFEMRLQRAADNMDAELPHDKDRLNYTEVECPECGNETIAVSLAGKAHCHFCEEDRYVEECLRCGNKIGRYSKFTENDLGVCTWCQDAADQDES